MLMISEVIDEFLLSSAGNGNNNNGDNAGTAGFEGFDFRSKLKKSYH